MTTNHENPLPHLFIGDWTILATDGSGSIATLKNVTISQEENGCPRGLHYKLETQDSSIVFKSLAMTWRNDLSNCPSCATTVDEQICISFWRHSSYDVIFALGNDAENNPTEIWSARRTTISPQPPTEEITQEVISGLVRKKWKIRLSAGHHGAKNKVWLRRLKVTGAMDDSWTTEGLGLFGLFNQKESTGNGSPDQSPVLYDILAYDESVRSFNSIFGVRSLNYYWKEDPTKCCVFATFNNKFSLPETHFPGSGLHFEHKLGYLMDFETTQIGNRTTGVDADPPHAPEGSDPDTNDPDIGVWVGEPDV